jgi:hypothetical protein
MEIIIAYRRADRGESSRSDSRYHIILALSYRNVNQIDAIFQLFSAII